MIHNSSVIDKKAKISDKVKIGPFCYVGPNVELDDEVDIMMETWRYEINAFNTIYSRFAPLFAPKTN